MLLEMLKVPHLDKARSEVQAVNLDKIHITGSSFAPAAAQTPAPILTKVVRTATWLVKLATANNNTQPDGWSIHVMNQNENLQRTQETMFEEAWTNMASKKSLNKKRLALATCNAHFQNWPPSGFSKWSFVLAPGILLSFFTSSFELANMCTLTPKVQALKWKYRRNGATRTQKIETAKMQKTFAPPLPASSPMPQLLLPALRDHRYQHPSLQEW